MTWCIGHDFFMTLDIYISRVLKLYKHSLYCEPAKYHKTDMRINGGNIILIVLPIVGEVTTTASILLRGQWF